MKKVYLIISASIILFSCTKSNTSNSTSVGDFFTITINGHEYTNNATSTFGFSDQIGCNQKKFALDNISQINTSNVFFDIYLNHYQNSVDFKSSVVGQFLAHDFSFSTNIQNTVCNLDIEVACSNNNGANSPDYTLKTGGTHTVTSINQKSETSTSVYYTIAGTFSCSFLTNANQLINTSGKYQTTIQTLK